MIYNAVMSDDIIIKIAAKAIMETAHANGESITRAEAMARAEGKADGELRKLIEDWLGPDWR